MINQVGGSLQPGSQIGQLESNTLQFSDFLPKRFTFIGVVQRHLVGPLRRSQRQRAKGNAAPSQYS